MDIIEIENLVFTAIEQSLNGLEKEHPKFDFKRKWYNLTAKHEISEFIKDTSSIANTVGLDGFIVIGFDERTKEFNHSVFSDSGLKDSNELLPLVAKRVDRMFEINCYDIEILKNKISIIHLPPSLDKPHVIRRHQTYNRDGDLKKEEENRIFVRKNSNTYSASKYDIEFMYYDRKNIIPEYELICNYLPATSGFYFNSNRDLIFQSRLTIENVGRRTVAINKIDLTIEIERVGESENDFLTFMSTTELLINNIIVGNGEIWNKGVEFICEKNYWDLKQRDYNQLQQRYNIDKNIINIDKFNLTLSNNTIIHTKLVGCY